MLGVSIVSLIILLGILIFVHELGHFLAAKRLGVGVLKFSLGFGPRLIGKKVGETDYQIALVPLGGYVKLLGESEGEELSSDDSQRSFASQSVYRRFIIVAAGPLFNFLLAVLIFSLVNMIGVPRLSSKIGDIIANSPAAAAGIRANDLIREIDGVAIARWDRLAEKISRSEGNEMRLIVLRGDRTLELNVTPQADKGRNIFGEEIVVYRIGIKPSKETFIERLNPVAALAGAVVQTGNIAVLTVQGIVKMIQGIISPRNLGGPILIAQMAGSQAREGIIPFLLFMALLSINLAIINLLPVPVLDGGHLMFFLIEMVRRKEMSLKWRERAQQVGLTLILLLMAFAIFFDIERLSLKLFG